MSKKYYNIKYLFVALVLVASCGVDITSNKNISLTERTKTLTGANLKPLNFRKPIVQADIYSGVEMAPSESLLGISNPVLLVSEQSNANDYKYASSLCSVINSSFSGATCINYLANGKDKKTLLKKEYYYGSSSKQTDAIADLVILRIDEYENYMKNRRPEDVPLDIIAYLHGDYFLMFSPSSQPAFTIEQLAQSGKRAINVAAFNSTAREYFQKYVSEFIGNKTINIDLLDENNPASRRIINASICNPSKYDLFIHFGDSLPKIVLDKIASCPTSIQPMGLSENTLLSIEQRSYELSLADITTYFPESSTAVFLSKYLDFAKTKAIAVNSDEINGKAINIAERVEPKDTEGKVGLPQIKEGNLQQTVRTTKVYELVGSYKTILEKPKQNEQKLYFDSNAAIKTFGVRYVLLASRYTRRDVIINVLNGIFMDYDLTKQNYITNDIEKYSIKDMMLGTSSKQYGQYHIGVYYYPRAYLLANLKGTPDQDELVKVVASGVTLDMVPSFFGPKEPTYMQIQTIAEKSKNLAQRRKEFSAIQILQRDYAEIEKTINILKEQGIQDPYSVGSSITNIQQIESPDVTAKQPAVTEPITAP